MSKSWTLQELQRMGVQAFAQKDPSIKPSTFKHYKSSYRSVLTLLGQQCQHPNSTRFTGKRVERVIRMSPFADTTKQNMVSALRYVLKRARSQHTGIKPSRCGTLFERDLRNVLWERKREYGDRLVIAEKKVFGRKLDGSEWEIDIYFTFDGVGVGIEAREQYSSGSTLDKIPTAVLHLEATMQVMPEMQRGYVVVRGSELIRYVRQLRINGYGPLASHMSKINIVTMEEFVELLDRGKII